jgi:PAS domain S-box-containing protein
MDQQPASRNIQRELDLLTAAVDQAADAIMVIDPQTYKYLHINQAAERIYGVPREDMFARGVLGVSEMLNLMPAGEIPTMYRQLIDEYPKAATGIFKFTTPAGVPTIIESRRQAVNVGGQWLIVSVGRDVRQQHAERQKLELLAMAMDEAADAIFVIDPEAYKYVAVNKAAASLYGLPRQDMIDRGMEWANSAFKGLRTREQLLALHHEAIGRYPEALREVREFPRRDGVPARILETTRRAMQVDGKWLVVSVRRDVTGHQHSLRQLRILGAAINNAPDAILVIDPQALEYVDVNEACARMFGKSRDEMLRPGAMRKVIEARGWQEAQTRETYDQLIAEGKSTTALIPVRVQGKDVILETIRRAVEVEGRWLIVSMMRDITSRLAAERDSQQLQAALNDVHDPIYVIDPETMEWTYVNESAGRVFGMASQDLMQLGLKKAMERVGIWSLDELRAMYRELIEKYPEAQSETRTLALPGRPEFVLEYTRRAIRAGDAWRIVTVTHDVTALVHAAAQLEQRAAELARSNRDLEQFAYVTSHDLSEPLRMIASYTQLLDRRYRKLLDDDGKDFMAFIVDGAHRMRQLIDDLLVYSRIGRSDAKMENHRLDEPLDRALANLEHAVRDAGASIDRPRELPVVPCNPSAIAQLFQNLVGNALKFRGDRPMVVRIGAEREGDMWHLSVADNGIGIAPEYFDRIFVIFQRLHTRERYEGTGIGLAICKKVVERHGGHIWVESAPGEGASFHFTLPAELRPE